MKRNSQIHGNTGNVATIAKIYTVDSFIEACCQICAKDAPNLIGYFARAHRFYGHYKAYCHLNRLPAADFQSVMSHLKKTFKITDRLIYRNNEPDLEILGIMLRYLPLRRFKNEKSYRNRSTTYKRRGL